MPVPPAPTTQPAAPETPIAAVPAGIVAKFLDLAERTGRNLRLRLGEMLYAAGFIAQVLRETVRFFNKRQTGYRVLVMQILFTGVEALGIVSVLALAVGAIIIIQGSALLPQFGQGKLMYTALVLIVTRELGPILTAFIIIARSGTAIATEIAGMVVSHEVEAFLAFGINPLSYMVVPRFVGVMVAMIILNIYFSVMGLLGGYIIASLVASIPFADYTANLLNELSADDITLSLVKATVFGGIVSLVSTYAGFSVNRASTEIPQAGIRAVGKCFVWCILADALISLMFYLLQ
jgi:phospholipid/cholesterol/gamma-HCH transport system permease protein